MKLAAFLCVLMIGLVSGEKLHCKMQVDSFCSRQDAPFPDCSSRLKHYSFMDYFNGLVRTHLSHSFQYLLMSTHFGSYTSNREGFAKLYRKLSNTAWEDAIDLVKYIAKKGHSMDFRKLTTQDTAVGSSTFSMTEVESLAHALNMAQNLAEEVHFAHKQVTKPSTDYHDADAMNYLEEKLAQKHADIIRELSGHTNDLAGLIKGGSSNLAIYFFDDHLKSLY